MALRIIAVLLLVAFLALQYRLWLSPNGMRDLWRTEARSRPRPRRTTGSPSAIARSPPRCVISRKGGPRSRSAAHRPRHGRQQRDFFQVVPPPAAAPPPRRNGVPPRRGSMSGVSASGPWFRQPACERFGGRRPSSTSAAWRPVLSWSLSALLAEPAIRAIVVALSDGDAALPGSRKRRTTRANVSRRGARELSVASALEALAGDARDADWVLVHDAARPCLQLEDCGRWSARWAMISRRLLAAPVGDTLRPRGATRRSDRTVPREGLWRALTPQMFRYGVLRRALRLSIERERAVTDEASAVEALGCDRAWCRDARQPENTLPGDCGQLHT